MMGKKTYDQVASFGRWPYEGKKCCVFSAQRVDDPRVTAISDPLPFIKYIRGESGRNIWLAGGSQIISLFVNQGLLNEIILAIMPVILGSGIPLFAVFNSQVNCELIGERTYDPGLVQMHYRVLTEH